MGALLSVRLGDDEDGAARALHQLDRHAAEELGGDAPAVRGPADDEVRLALLREKQDPADHLARPDLAAGLDAGLGEPADGAVDRVLRERRELRARDR